MTNDTTVATDGSTGEQRDLIDEGVPWETDQDPWPDDYQAAATFTFDLDAGELWRAAGSVDPEFARISYRGEYGPKVGVPRILDVFDRHDAQCTFFVPGKVAADWPAVVQRIHAAGHEIAHHGYTHDSPRNMPPEREEREFKQALDLFDDLLGETPTGYRTPGGTTDQTMELVLAAGMTYDASSQATDVPYLRDSGDLVEIPNCYLLDDFVYWGYNMSPAFEFQAGITPVQQVFEAWRAEFEGLYDRRRLFVPTMHPQVVGRASRVDMLDRLLERVLATDDTWVGTCADVASHWHESVV
ncbi:polysaccharide deacetylase family protein [Halomicrobium katesii]|uniref:polysaccharide deacetylase family protein n=1 Tax=Halomicrobium katesii TaxID=437163 RepID=UPI000371A91E|nr:polysaccharide deacetylase [Halomicrobium katesii]